MLEFKATIENYANLFTF